jgi:hypothetical protein
MSSTFRPHILVSGELSTWRLKARICPIFSRDLLTCVASIHISPMLDLPVSCIIVREPNVDGGGGFPAIVLASPG